MAEERIESIREALRRGEERINRSKAVLAQIKTRELERTKRPPRRTPE